MSDKKFAKGVINFSTDSRVGAVSFGKLPNEILERVLMILISSEDVRIDSDGELHTNFYKNKRRNGYEKRMINNIPQCQYL